MRKENERKKRHSEIFYSILCDVSLRNKKALQISGCNPLKQKNQR